MIKAYLCAYGFFVVGSTVFPVNYSKRHNKFLFLALAGAIYGSSCEAENEISNVVYYKKV